MIVSMKRVLPPVVVVLALWLGCLAQGNEGPRRLENPQEMNLPGGSRILFKGFNAPALGREASYSIFLPPAYEKEPERMFPVIYFLHGMWNDHTSWAVERYGDIPTTLEAMMLDGRIPQAVLVHPNGENSFYTDYLDGSLKFETMVVTDLIREIEENYRVKSDRNSRALGGVSMGGYGALKIAMKHPELYASVAGISPIVLIGEDPSRYIMASDSRLSRYLSEALKPVYGMPFDLAHWKKNSIESLAETASFDGLAIFFAYGTADRYNDMFPIGKGIEALDAKLDKRQIEHEYKVYQDGPHGWRLVLDHLDDVADFLTRSFD